MNTLNEDWAEDLMYAGSGAHRYVCFFKGKKREVYADSHRDAQRKASYLFGTDREWEVSANLIERNAN